MTLRVGILGGGYMGTIRREALAVRADCEIAAVFDGSDDRWTEIVDDRSIDCVFVCLPSHLTCVAVCRALASGKHVLAEKPPGLSVDEVRAMIEVESKSGRALKFGFNHRYHPAVLAAEQHLASGALGEVLWLRGRYGKPIAEGFASGWRADRGRAGAGIFLDQGIHMLDLMRAFSGGFDEARAFAARSESTEVEDDLVAILRRGDRIASLHSSHTQSPPLFSLELGTRLGTLELRGLLSRSGRYGPERLIWRPRTGGERAETFTEDRSWSLEIDELFEAARGGCRIRVGSSAEALALMVLVEAIYESAGWPLGVHRAVPE